MRCAHAKPVPDGTKDFYAGDAVTKETFVRRPSSPPLVIPATAVVQLSPKTHDNKDSKTDAVKVIGTEATQVNAPARPKRARVAR